MEPQTLVTTGNGDPATEWKNSIGKRYECSNLVRIAVVSYCGLTVRRMDTMSRGLSSLTVSRNVRRSLIVVPACFVSGTIQLVCLFVETNIMKVRRQNAP